MEYLTKENFDQKISEGIVLVDFFANWCGPCRMLSPFLEEMAEQFSGKIAIYKVDVDNDPQLAERYDVFSIPNLIIFKDGKKFNQMVGFNGEEALEDFIKSSLQEEKS